MSHVEPDARDRLLGHRPKDVKALSYEVSPVAYLVDELSKIHALIPGLHSGAWSSICRKSDLLLTKTLALRRIGANRDHGPDQTRDHATKISGR